MSAGLCVCDDDVLKPDALKIGCISDVVDYNALMPFYYNFG